MSIKNDFFDLLGKILQDEFNIDINVKSIKAKDSINDLGLDSFEIVELMHEIEVQMGIKIENEELQKIGTVEELIDLIAEKERHG